MKASVPFFFLLNMLVLLLSGATLSVAAEEPEIRDIVVTTSQDKLLLSAGVQNAFPLSLLTDLHRGRAIIFTYDLELVKVGSWFNSTLAEWAVSRSLYYDQKRKTYQIVFSEQRDKLYETTDLAEIKKLAAEINAISVLDLSQLASDETYAIHLRMRLQGQHPDSMFQRLFSSSPDWEAETDWRTIEFRY